jgi:hypothetical protein
LLLLLVGPIVLIQCRKCFVDESERYGTVVAHGIHLQRLGQGLDYFSNVKYNPLGSFGIG